ncbi:hypothetical protein Acid7E03_32600 [Acidisoma sp. 7E03]
MAWVIQRGAMMGFAVVAALAVAAPAWAQNGANPAATVNGTVPTSEGNVWNGLDHQPTEAEVPQGTLQQQNQINNQLNQIGQQLMDAKLPKEPKGAPPVSGN